MFHLLHRHFENGRGMTPSLNNGRLLTKTKANKIKLNNIL